MNGSDPIVDEAVAKLDAVNAFLRQRVEDPYDFEQTLPALVQLAGAPQPPVAAVDVPEGFTGAFNPLPPGAEVVPAAVPGPA